VAAITGGPGTRYAIIRPIRQSRLRCIWFGGCACAPTEEQARTFGVGHITTANDFPGRPEHVVELGVDYFVIGRGRFPNLTTLVVVTDQVLPALNAVVRRL